jgi:hypothetical protein
VKVSDSERERRSVQAKRLHSEGKFGGPTPGAGRPSKLRTKLANDLAKLITGMNESELALAIHFLTALVRIARNDIEINSNGAPT